MGVHQGAQCDRASLAQNYYYNGLRFFYPEVNETFCGDGIVSVEMPLPSYFAAILYKFFGYNEQWFRLLTFTFFTIGMYALFLWFKLYFKTLTAFALLLIINSSPIILFYSISFITANTLLSYLISVNQVFAILGNIGEHTGSFIGILIFTTVFFFIFCAWANHLIIF